MANPVHPEHRRHLRHSSKFPVVYGAMLLLSLHWAVVTYINSTFLEQFISNQAIGALYMIGSTITILAFVFISRVLKELGNYHLTIGLALAEVFVLLGMAATTDMRIVIPLFIAHHAIVPLLLFNLDVFMESFIGNHEERTGGKRGLLLTFMSIAGAIAPLTSGFLIGDGTPRFFLAYIVSALIMLPFIWIIVNNLKHFKDPRYESIEIVSSLRHFWTHRSLRYVFVAHFLLQLFFAWMVIYTPLYLSTVVGFGWNEIGVIFFFALLAYVILEYPIGEIADRYIGEKEMMATGFLILALSTAWLTFISTPSLIPWMVTMFITRVGASLVETTTESYFFKQIGGSDSNVISFFRITRPLAYVLGALIGSFTLLYVELAHLFVILGICLIPGIPLALLLKDTK